MISRIGPILALTLVANPALAHPGQTSLYGFAAGFAHPLLGLDHLLAMTALGLWAGLAGGRAVWAWPLAFLGVTVASALLAVAGVGLPGVEAAVALSVVLGGLAVALRAPLPLLVGALATAAFAVFHGYAHGAELPADADLPAAIAGFAAATLLLHGLGIGLAFSFARLSNAWVTRLAGGAVAAAGLAFLVG
jgi:urease accessory protein